MLEFFQCYNESVRFFISHTGKLVLYIYTYNLHIILYINFILRNINSVKYSKLKNIGRNCF